MPKVTEEYKAEKRERIIAAAIEVMKRKPLYDIKMLDVIKEADLSKGGIYLYFKDIDEVIVEVVNSITREEREVCFEDICEDNDVEGSLLRVFALLGKYIDTTPDLVGKLRFELMTLIANYPEKIGTIMVKLKLKDIGNKFLGVVESLIRQGIEQEIFQKDIPVDIVLTNIGSYIDGVSERVTHTRVYRLAQMEYPVHVYLEQYAKSMVKGMKK